MKPRNYSGYKAPKKAIALQFDAEPQDAPVVKAKGTRAAAERILEIAHDNQIPIQEDAALVELLIKIDLEEQIPVELYGVVAEVLALVYRLEKRSETYRK